MDGFVLLGFACSLEIDAAACTEATLRDGRQGVKSNPTRHEVYRPAAAPLAVNCWICAIAAVRATSACGPAF